MAQESWARWVTKPGTVVVPGAPRQSHAQELAIEYLGSVLRPICYYALDHDDAPLTADYSKSSRCTRAEARLMLFTL